MIDHFEGPYRFLSNFHPCGVRLDGIVYPSVEHAYQAAKTNDATERERIRRAPRAGDAKAFGNKLVKVDDWEVRRQATMRMLLRQKFAYGSKLASQLLDTGVDELVEGNWWNDTFWGVCRGKGENRLGYLLMGIRSDLRKAAQAAKFKLDEVDCADAPIGETPYKEE